MLSFSCKSSFAKERERLKVPPGTCKSSNWPIVGFINHCCPLTGFVKVWGRSRLLQSISAKNPGCVCAAMGFNCNPTAWNDEFGTLTLHRMEPHIDSHGKKNKPEGLQVSPLPLVSITSSKMLLLSTQFLVTRRIVYSVPGSRASLG